MDEVKVLTGTLPAEYGHTTGGVVSVVKKGGTNSLHGMAADLGRTRMMTHRQFFNLYKTSDPQPGAPDGVPAWFMQPDASISGPVVIPHLYNGRNKTFFFFGYQKLIEKKSAAFTSQTPTPASLAGDFTFGGVGLPLYDPLTTRQLTDGTWTRDALPGNIVPKNRFDPVAAKIIGMNPWVPPNTPGSLTSTGPVSNYTWASKSRTFFEDFSQRIDQQFSSDFKLYGSYTYNHQSGLGRPTSVALPVVRRGQRHPHAVYPAEPVHRRHQAVRTHPCSTISGWATTDRGTTRSCPPTIRTGRKRWEFPTIARC